MKFFLSSILIHCLLICFSFTFKNHTRNNWPQSNIQISMATKAKEINRFPSPTCGRGIKGEGLLISKPPHPRPLPQVGEGIILEKKTLRSVPILLSNNNHSPQYPEKAKKMMIEGDILLMLTVGINGDVIDAKIINGPDHGFWRSALQVAKNLKFLPATDDEGEPKIAQIEHKVVFRLKRYL